MSKRRLEEVFNAEVLFRLWDDNVNKDIQREAINNVRVYNQVKYQEDPYFRVLADTLVSVVLANADKFYVEKIINIIKDLVRDNVKFKQILLEDE